MFLLIYPCRSSKPWLPRHGHVVKVVLFLCGRGRWLFCRRRRRRPLLHRWRRPGLCLREFQVLLRRVPLPVEELVLRHSHVTRAAVVVLVRPVIALVRRESGVSGCRLSREGSVAIGKEIVAEFISRLRIWHDGELLQISLQKRVPVMWRLLQGAY